MLILNKIYKAGSTEDAICTEDVSEIYSVVVLNTDTNEEYTISRSTSDWAYEFISKFGKLPFGFSEKYMFSTTKKGYSLYQTLEFVGKREGYNERYMKSWGTLEIIDGEFPSLDSFLCAYVFRSGHSYSVIRGFALAIENEIEYLRLEDILLPPRIKTYISDTEFIVPYNSAKVMFSYSSLAGSFSGALYRFKDRSKFDVIMTKAYTLKR